MKIQQRNGIMLAATVAGALLAACSTETESGRPVGDRAAALGVEAYDIEDDGVTLRDGDGAVIARIATQTHADGAQSMTVVSDAHEIAIEATPASTMSVIADGVELGTTAPGSMLEVEVTPEQLDDVLLMLAVSEDLALGEFALSEADDVSEYTDAQMCYQLKLCAKWGDLEIVCVAVQICFGGGS